ncbi:DUF6776 family protein [Halopseudomonas aestusnigri]|uniref:Uncharacterized protein n=1 Tax=Halopseudomonas aestusnigri TaxID=857252 RepID=A0AAQ1G9R9_9GAMM|nr:DUF6776 family protein [Halopseudomonas aestusnigri]OWL84735.1 hypothetical protein B7O88_15995 [Halopseudomonas aestusnigri]SEG68748.1 hypothetical protein SAMN05216586_11591 [Halopseudomonas aestusnigri]
MTLQPRESRMQRRWRRAVVILLLISIPVSAWQGWEAAMRHQQPLELERLALVESQAQLTSELEEARQRYHQLEVDLLVARDAVAEGQQIIHELEAQLFKQQQSLAQYQGVLAPSAMAPGLRIQAFELQATDSPEAFRYKVMVSRVGDESDTLEASLAVSVKGLLNGKTEELSLADLSPSLGDDQLALNFRYFQVVPARSEQALLILPDGFDPQQVKLVATRNGDTLVEQVFDWTVTGAEH